MGTIKYDYYDKEIHNGEFTTHVIDFKVGESYRILVSKKRTTKIIIAAIVDDGVIVFRFYDKDDDGNPFWNYDLRPDIFLTADIECADDLCYDILERARGKQ